MLLNVGEAELAEGAVGGGDQPTKNGSRFAFHKKKQRDWLEAIVTVTAV
jgi:hypothetical protein